MDARNRPPVLATLVPAKRQRAGRAKTRAFLRTRADQEAARPETKRSQHNATERRRIEVMNAAMDKLREACGLPADAKKIDVLHRARALIVAKTATDVVDAFLDPCMFDDLV